MKNQLFAYLFCFLSVLCFFSNNLHAQQNSNSFVVVELFTSEGCSSCPPADKIVSEIISDARKNKKPVYAMSFHVDYWNKFGWKDPYSSFQFTNRQKNYSDALGEPEIYTPQVFVNGKSNFVGSDKKRLQAEIDKELKTSPAISLKLSKGDRTTVDTLIINYESSKTDRNFNVYVALVQRGLTSKVSKGENAGKVLQHDNVVRVFESVPLTSATGSMKIPVAKFKLNSTFSVYGYVQQKQTKKILAATGFDLP